MRRVTSRRIIYQFLSLAFVTSMSGRALAECPPNFGGAVPYMPANTRFIVADLNNDSNGDFVYCFPSSNSILGAYLGNGDGTFTWSGQFQAGNVASALAVGDLNQDGYVDLAVANTTGDNVSIIQGDGDGTFQPAIFLSAADAPRCIAIDDLNGDAKLDLVVGYGSGNHIHVFRGNGDNSFQPPVNYPSFGNPFDIFTGDLNHDAIPDVVMAESNRIEIMLGNGDGTLQSGVAHTVLGDLYQDLSLQDLNGDGHLDVGSGDRNGFDFKVFLGNGDGTLQSPLSSPVCASCFVGGSALADVNGDKRLDAIVGVDLNVLHVLLGNNDGTFQAAVPFPGATGYMTRERVSISDFDNDNRPDVICSGSSGLAITLNTGSCIGFSPQPINQTVAAGQNAVLTVGVLGTGPFSYQWRRNGLAISNGGHFSGARTNTLTVSNVSSTEVGVYDVVVTGGCNGSIGATSRTATLNIDVCKGDLNNDNQFDGGDVQAIVDALLAGETCP